MELGQQQARRLAIPPPQDLHADAPSGRPSSDGGQQKYSERLYQPLGTCQVSFCGKKTETEMPPAHLPQDTS